jgi:hypothetical protein
LASLFKIRCELVLENLALRQQLAIYKRCHPRPNLEPADRLFWVWLAKIWTGWRSVLLIVKPETVVGWHRKGFKLFWRKLSQQNLVGRPSVNADIIALIKKMAQANPLRGSAAHPRGNAQTRDRSVGAHYFSVAAQRSTAAI